MRMWFTYINNPIAIGSSLLASVLLSRIFPANEHICLNIHRLCFVNNWLHYPLSDNNVLQPTHAFNRISKGSRTGQPYNNSKGENPVDAWGTSQYANNR